MKKFFLAAIATVVVFSACKKDDDSPKLTNLEMLQAHKWVTYSFFREANGFSVDMYADEDCEKDNPWEFKTDMTLEITKGENICPDGKQEMLGIGQYQLNNAQDTLILGDENQTVSPLKIVSISLDELVLEQEIQDDLFTYLNKIVMKKL